MRNLIDLARDVIDFKNRYKSNHLTFVTRRNAIISIGKNYEDKSHTIAARWGFIDGKIHSELDALIKASRQEIKMSRCAIWNIRIDRHDKIKMAKPCIRCQKLIKSFGIGEIWWTTNNGEFAC